MALFGKKDKDKKDKKADQAAVVAPAVVVPTKGNFSSYKNITGAHVTEKASSLAALGQYVFRISPDANKIEVRRSVENLYKVKVKDVKILKMPSKTRQVGRHRGIRPGFKKAIVTLQTGDKIDIN